MEHLERVIYPQSALERAYPRWQVWQVEETGEWWAAVRANLTKREIAVGCEPYRSAQTPSELAALLDADDQKASVSRLAIRLVTWGLDDDHVQHAYGDFALHPVRPLWRVARAESTTSAPCPVALDDPAVIVAHAGDGWAYAVYPLRA